jgi:hypothetical protein
MLLIFLNWDKKSFFLSEKNVYNNWLVSNQSIFIFNYYVTKILFLKYMTFEEKKTCKTGTQKLLWHYYHKWKAFKTYLIKSLIWAEDNVLSPLTCNNQSDWWTSQPIINV